MSVAIPALLAVATLGLLASRWMRADGVAVLALTAAVLLGLVSPGEALSGFSQPVIVTGAALVVLAGAVHRSGIVELPARGLGGRFHLTSLVLAGFGVLIALLAAISGRVGTRSAIRPTLADTTGESTDRRRMLLNAVCLLGGLMTVVGGLPNLLVSAIRHDMLGAEFGVLAFLPVGGTLLVVGLVTFLAAAALAPRIDRTTETATAAGLRRVRSFTSEVVLPAGSPIVGRPLSSLDTVEHGALRVVALIREGYRRIEPRPDWLLEADDVVVLDCEPAVLQRLIERYGFTIGGTGAASGTLSGSGVLEAVVTQSSELIGHSPADSRLRQRFGINLLAIGRNDDHSPGRLHRTKLRAGDIIVLQGDYDTMPGVLAGLGCLMLAERRLRIGRRQQIVLPILTLLAALALAGFGLAPLWLALLLGVLVLALTRVLSLQDIYETTPWPGLVLLASLIPLAAALHASAPAAALALTLGNLAAGAGPVLVAGAVVLATAVLTGLFGSAPAVLLLAPLAVTMAFPAGVSPDLLLLAVATGAAVDMLDPGGFVAVAVPGPGRLARSRRA